MGITNKRLREETKMSFQLIIRLTPAAHRTGNTVKSATENGMLVNNPAICERDGASNGNERGNGGKCEREVTVGSTSRRNNYCDGIDSSTQGSSWTRRS